MEKDNKEREESYELKHNDNNITYVRRNVQKERNACERPRAGVPANKIG